MDGTNSQIMLTPGYLDLRALAVYSSCSVRWLRDRLADQAAPLPYHRVEGKILIRREDFDLWMDGFRTIHQSADIETLVEDVMSDLIGKKSA